MVEYEKQDCKLYAPSDLFEMEKIRRLWEYLQSKFNIDLEIFANILLKCEKAGKTTWTDEELFKLVFELQQAQQLSDYDVLVREIVNYNA